MILEKESSTVQCTFWSVLVNRAIQAERFPFILGHLHPYLFYLSLISESLKPTLSHKKFVIILYSNYL